MNYVVVDLEWNQAMSSKSSVFNKLPIHLRGEIIQIGAVRLNDDMTPGEEFQIDVKPVYFKRMHYKVKKLTGFDKERLSHGVPFAEAFRQFREWCGEDVTFITWGYDDQGIMEQNIIIHDLDWDWIAGWINLQLIYNLQTGGDKNQKSLGTAMEHFGIEQTRVAVSYTHLRGTPSSLLRLPSVRRVLKRSARTQAHISLVVVLPLEPTTPTTGPANMSRQRRASAAMAFVTSGTTMTPPSTPSGTRSARTQGEPWLSAEAM